ncbi:MAG TPA: hypothetical protein PLD23_14955 [Armatimonadota bacterium]|nr:hypothetical protein [Armatimonadota bacterium]
MNDVGTRNLLEIEALNQRGGRMLSFVDLVDAGTMSADLAAFLLAAVRSGASFITGARPGGAGKSTVLASLLSFLPPGERIVCVAGRDLNSLPPHACLLAHEIGDGPYYGYIWGRDVGRWLGHARDGTRVASCIHADTIDQVYDVFASPALAIPRDDWSLLRLAVFLHVDRQSGSIRRRVSTVYWTPPGRDWPQVVFRWDPDGDRFLQECDPGLDGGEWDRARVDIDRVFHRGLRQLGEVRDALSP